MRWTLDYTAQQSSGIVAWRRDTDHIEKAFVFGGMPARSGVTSALLVRSGWNGVDDVFSGADNFFQAYAPEAQPARLIEKLGERYEIAQTDIKKWTVGSPIQGPLDAIEAIRGKQPFAADEVQRVTVRLAPSVVAVVDNRDIPDICLQHMIAVMLVDKTVSFQAAHDKPRMQEPAVLRQRAKVNFVRDEELSKVLPLRVTIVEIDLTDGNRLSERVAAVRGTPRNPMSRRGDRKGTRSHRANSGTRNVGAPDRDGIRDRRDDGHSNIAVAPSAWLTSDLGDKQLMLVYGVGTVGWPLLAHIWTLTGCRRIGNERTYGPG
jgi:2-methylcitrate dehydratase PrpD